ncbi:MAG: GNAT family N-acetyltransferase [Jatrophihabitantaceae bacterium]
MQSDDDGSAYPVRIASYSDADLPAGIAEQVRALIQQAWPAEPPEPAEPAETTEPGGLSATGHDPALSPITMVLTRGSTVLSCLSVLSKPIVHGAASYLASGISTMVTDRTQRRHRYGLRLASAARQFMARSGADLGVFTCDRSLQDFYLQAGWSHFDQTVLIGGTRQDPLASDQFDKVCLGSLFSTRAIAASTTFIATRIELYPGAIDRLW